VEVVCRKPLALRTTDDNPNDPRHERKKVPYLSLSLFHSPSLSPSLPSAAPKLTFLCSSTSKRASPSNPPATHRHPPPPTTTHHPPDSTSYFSTPSCHRFSSRQPSLSISLSRLPSLLVPRASLEGYKTFERACPYRGSRVRYRGVILKRLAGRTKEKPHEPTLRD
jgi:hypothetical protein